MGYFYEMVLEDKFFGAVVLLITILIVVVIGSITYEVIKEKILVKEKVEVVSEVLIKGKETSTSTMLVNNVGDTGIVMPSNDYYVIFEYKEKVYENITTSKIYRRLSEGEVVEAKIVEYLDKDGDIIKVRADFRGVLG